MSDYHTSVLLQEAVESLNVEKNGKYIDATLGGGGHTGAILEKGGIVLGIDVDEKALEVVNKNHKSQITKNRLFLKKGNFKDLDKIAKEERFEEVNGILFDLGVSSHQLDTPERGFSFQNNAPLDMRMDKSLAVTAADLVNGLTKGELYELFTQLGEESFARTISNHIVRARELKRIETTRELADIAIRSYPKGFHKIHPATKIFQALRIAVNGELEALRLALPKSLGLLTKQGRVAVISFHSLEDRIVKNAFKQWEEEKMGIVITKKPIEAGKNEQDKNNRSRSAKLRIFKKL